jgi:hypothetical protein
MAPRKQMTAESAQQEPGPAVRAMCPQRAAWQRELIEEAPALREQYRQACEAVEAARALVESGDKSARYVLKFQNAAFEISARLNQILNQNPVRLRESCRDAELNRQAVLLLNRRNRCQQELQTMLLAAEDCGRRWSRLLAEVAAAFGTEGSDWSLSAGDELEILQPGRGHSAGVGDRERQRMVFEFQTRLQRLGEEKSLADLQSSEAGVEHDAALQAFEENRQARTWSVH